LPHRDFVLLGLGNAAGYLAGVFVFFMGDLAGIGFWGSTLIWRNKPDMRVLELGISRHLWEINHGLGLNNCVRTA